MSAQSVLEFYCTRWGSEHIPWEAFAQSVKDSGYHGIEYGIAANTTQSELDKVWNLASQHQLKIIPHHYDTVTRNFSQHQEEFSRWFEMVSPYPAEKINAQTGRDCFSWEENKILFQVACSHQENSAVQVIHETHRQRCLFAAHAARTALERIPELKITLDISHWICVAENFLQDQTDAVDIAIRRTEHVHARIGQPQGPQVNDPRAPEWTDAVNTHVNWWKAIAKRFAQTGKILTITPEFGPAPYMPCAPFTNSPYANQWDINLHMMALLRERL
ncbi:MAG: sugar phosphate isomerase/epimerase [Cellvibrio sp.]|uniref:sugar phosphate isomerase/epimerase family protein n=1 Tax=Cellvibrio sp. TaxID=1965322 RepID=UPI0031AC2FBE